MFRRVPDFIATQGATKLLERLDTFEWQDGQNTASFAKNRKFNEQLTFETEAARPLLREIGQAVLQHPLVRGFAQPKRLSRVLFNRYSEGMHYGSHNDAAITSGGGQGEGRADVSFTVFLTPPDSYGGGELVLESTLGEVSLKEGQGDMVLYDTGISHRVEKLTSGTRIAAVGWIESWVADPQARAVLAELGDAITAAAGRDAEGKEAIRLRRIRGNLLRRWAR